MLCLTPQISLIDMKTFNVETNFKHWDVQLISCCNKVIILIYSRPGDDHEYCKILQQQIFAILLFYKNKYK